MALDSGCSESRAQRVMMHMRNLIRFYGILDVVLIAWVVFSAIRIGEIPIVTNLMESLAIASSFGTPFGGALAISAFVVFMSLFASGPLLIFLKRAGVYLAFLQAPFRVLWIIQPSFFFLALAKGAGLFYWVQIGLVLALEVFKVVSLVVWIRVSMPTESVSENICD